MTARAPGRWETGEAAGGEAAPEENERNDRTGRRGGAPPNRSIWRGVWDWDLWGESGKVITFEM